MITAPANWDTLWADQESKLELRLVLSVGVSSTTLATFTNADLVSCSLEGSLFKNISIGNVCSARLRFVLRGVASIFGIFEEGQKVTFSCRLKKGNTSTSYVSQGVYYVQSFTLQGSGDIEVIAYDELNKMQNYVSQNTSNSAFSSYMSRLSNMYGRNCNIADLTSATLYDTTNIMNSSSSTTVYGIRVKGTANDLEARKVLQTVATLAGGNIAINKSDRMGLYRLNGGPTITDSPAGAVVTVTSLYKDDRPTVVTGVNLKSDGGTYYSSSGWRIDGQTTNKVTVDGSIELSQTVYRNLKADNLNIRASNVRAEGAYISPLFELGDIVSIDLGNGQYYNFQIADYSVNYAGGCWGYIGFPADKDAFFFSLASIWNNTNGWIESWTLTYNGNLSGERIEIPDKYRIVFPQIVEAIGSSSNTNYYNVAYFSNVNTISGTITYISNGVDGTSGTQTASVTCYLSTQYLPIERRASSGSYPLFYWSNLVFFCSGIPDNAVGTQVTSHTLKSTNASDSKYYINMGH